jgi:hypothetical protein
MENDSIIKQANELVQKLFGVPMQTRSFNRVTVVITTPTEEFSAQGNTKKEAKDAACKKIIDFYSLRQQCPSNYKFGKDFNLKEHCGHCTVQLQCREAYQLLGK